MIHDAEVASASKITPGAVSARAINLEELPFPGNELHCLIVLEHSLNFLNPKFAAIQTVHFETILDPIQTEFRPQKTLQPKSYEHELLQGMQVLSYQPQSSVSMVERNSLC